MGCMLSSSKTLPAAAANEKLLNKRIEAMLDESSADESSAVKILLLGAGECGKSTILKQMKILHGNGFSLAEKKSFRSLIRKNVMDSIRSLCTAALEFRLQFDSAENEDRAIRIAQSDLKYAEAEHLRDIQLLWRDQAIQNALSRANEFHLLDSADFFLSQAERVLAAEYVPTEADILRSRLRTTGIIKQEFTINNAQFTMYDVGGQRGERKKWIHCFDAVTAILFIASLSEYDQVLAEDHTRNRMVESLHLFEGIVNLPWFKNTSTLLFLNKKDLFERKVERIDIGNYFPEYEGGLDYMLGLRFIQGMYFARNNDQANKTIYFHLTDATDTENIEFVWKATQHIILEQHLSHHGLMMC
eukprot:TRINITY_DN67856_c2_g1_i7.p2 TRINITY_DN67856_c2_g1~~TRINITY_DN67856_c2_g1_i7.p2  ORF type:complete len:359 (-),score=178.46 TRINITY_DN67856_c2_g1_i7:1606-2682(-)